MENIYKILERHFQQQTSKEEEDEVLKFKEKNNSEYLMLQQLWNSPSKINVSDYDSVKAWEHVVNDILKRKSNLHFIYSPFRQVAAVAFIVIVGSLFAYLLMQQHQKTPTFFAFETLSSQTDSVLLADGTTVWLNRNSTLYYPKNFDGKTRQVKLDGEAYFNVAKNAKQPFIVETSYSKVTVLGTSFNVNTDTISTKVHVCTGKVKVQSERSGSEAYLSPKQMAVVSREGLAKSSITNPNFLSWKTGDFLFEDTPLPTVIDELNRYYNKPIVLNTTKTGMLFSAHFEKAKQEDIIEIIKTTFNLNSYENTTYYEIR